MPPSTPPDSLLQALGLSGTPQPLAGGQNESFILDQIVLKPTLNVAETEWLCMMQQQLALKANPAYRIAGPILIPSSEGDSYTVNGWTATKFIDGIPDPQIRIAEVLPAARAMHEDLRQLFTEQPKCIVERVDRWAWADRVAWGLSLDDVPKVNREVRARVQPWLARLFACRMPADASLVRDQVVHGDLSGNILFSPQGQNLAPGIIDFSPLWRPAEYAEAIMVADGLTWRDHGKEAVEILGLDDFRLQMLVRALIFRVSTYCIQSDPDFVKANLGQMNVEKAVSLVEGLLSSTSATT